MCEVNKIIGVHTIIARNMGLVQLSDQQIVCAIKDEITFDRDSLNLGKAKIEQAFLTSFNVRLTWVHWEEHLITYADLRKTQNDTTQRKGLEYLNADKIAHRLKNLFKAEWDIKSIRFKK